MGSSQQFSLRWNNYLRHITSAFDSLRNDDDLVDVTLSCEGKKIRAHRMLLSACSTYFLELFKENPCQHPVIIFRNIKFEDLSALVDFMYQGEVNVVQEQLSSFLATAELLAIQGLSDGNGNDGHSEQTEPTMPDSPSLPAEPEVHLSNHSRAQKLLKATGLISGVSSPVSLFPLERTCDSPPSNKRRKCGPSTSGSNLVHKESDTPNRERRRNSNKKVVDITQDPVEIIPVMPTLKLEMPDYDDDDDPDASSCSYGDSNQGAGPGGTISAMSRLVSHGNDTASNCKPEPPDMYNTNSRDESESLSASEISHILAKPGSSGENQSQDSLQVTSQHGNVGVGNERNTTSKKMMLGYRCNLCEKVFKHLSSLNKHKQVHSGNTTCPICYKVLNRMVALKKHLLTRHSHQ